jgi:hypothetical protein
VVCPQIALDGLDWILGGGLLDRPTPDINTTTDETRVVIHAAAKLGRPEIL